MCIRDRYAVREQLEGLYTVHDEKYGYILSDDRRELLIDEEAAVVVREIFQMVLDGMLLTNIVKILNDSEIESPMVHNARVGHKAVSYTHLSRKNGQCQCEWLCICSSIRRFCGT